VNNIKALSRERNKLVYVFYDFGSLSIFYFVACLLVFHMVVNFSQFYALLGIISISLGFYRMKHDEFITNRTIKITVIVVLALLVLSFVLVEGLIISGVRETAKRKPDYIVILGAGINGRKMLQPQMQRVQVGMKYMRKYADIKVVLSGGRGYGEDISEAEAMRIYLVQHGINHDQIIMEQKSSNTIENIKFTSELLNNIDGRKDLKIAIVTSNFHMFRAKYLAKKYGFTPEGVAAPVNILLLPVFCIREYFSILKVIMLN
jgi:uncharacterized SAM-binding protein YcdF (DUF218 family)